MGKKKPFINKKNSSTYHLLHRSQRDVADDVLELDEGDVSQKMGMVLWPSPQNKSETDRAVLGASEERNAKLTEWREKLAQAGLLDTSAIEQERYLKPITGTGTFLDASGRVGNAFVDPRMHGGMQLKEDIDDAAMTLEVDRQFDSIPLTTDFMDEDIAEALFGDVEEGDFEELNDDFVLMAAKEPDPEEGDGNDNNNSNAGDDAFDFDAHVQRLLEKARIERAADATAAQRAFSKGDHQWGNRDRDFFSRLKPLRERNEDDEDDDDDNDGHHHFDMMDDSMLEEDGMTLLTTPGVVPALNPEEERALCEKFEETLLQYDSDEMGDCPEEEIHGPRPLEGDKELEAALNDFLQEKQDDIFMQGTRRNPNASTETDQKSNYNTGGSGFHALIGKKMVPASFKDLDAIATNPELNANPADEEEDDLLKNDPLATTFGGPSAKISSTIAPPPEEILIDGQSYFSEKLRNPFDCESILSTYSNLDNNPVTIGTSSRRRRNKKKNGGSVSGDQSSVGGSEIVPRIRLSQKTGLPIGVFDKDEDSDDDSDGPDLTTMSVNRGIARKKNETLEEKKARKAQLKKERQLARIQKKVTREVFQEEFEKRAADVVSHDIAGKTVFRFS